MLRAMLLTVVCWVLITTMHAADLALPTAKVTVPVPAGWSTVAVDLGKPFGTSDVVMDPAQERFISFLIIPPDVGDDFKGFYRGLADGFSKRQLNPTRGEIMIGTVVHQTVIVDLPGTDGPDRRSYVLFPALRLVVLTQYPIAAALQQPEVVAMLAGIRRTTP